MKYTRSAVNTAGRTKSRCPYPAIFASESSDSFDRGHDFRVCARNINDNRMRDFYSCSFIFFPSHFAAGRSVPTKLFPMYTPSQPVRDHQCAISGRPCMLNHYCNGYCYCTSRGRGADVVGRIRYGRIWFTESLDRNFIAPGVPAAFWHLACAKKTQKRRGRNHFFFYRNKKKNRRFVGDRGRIRRGAY